LLRRFQEKFLLRSKAWFSLIFWGVDAFTKLANSETDIAINLLVLFGQGIALFLLGAWLFKRRMNL